MPDGAVYPGSRNWRFLIAEAAVFLILARLLIAFVRFGRWRARLGPLLPARSGERPLPAMPHEGVSGTPADLVLAACAERAADRLPLFFRCLPRAMALQWMLRRRGRPAILALAALPGTARGSLDDLHAWVECCDCVLIGSSDRPYRIVARFGWIGSENCRFP